MSLNYQNQQSVYEEIYEKAKKLRANAILMASVAMEGEMSSAYEFYISRSMQAEAVITFCEQKLGMNK